ncbi:hypothetical protein [Rheinheimera maricola]|uniref:Uncharacterized protein n=1 Tax=Rheinheimera maricola TaxID=2793282 RepID=A0ABS7X9B0_9GAMM|nr:hypothetical protein [Rheinheimera maricola]MBZ9612131.1 hypothetical protein [Rheinheimera maricola]
MKTLSSSQQQLLKVLQITPLELGPAFVRETSTTTLAETDVTTESETLAVADLTSELAQDINLALPDGFSWHINPQSIAAELTDKQLITPTLSVLQQAEVKRALWHILGALDEN